MQNEPPRTYILLAQDPTGSQSEKKRCLSAGIYAFKQAANRVDVRLIIRRKVIYSVRIVRGGGVSSSAIGHFGFCDFASPHALRMMLGVAGIVMIFPIPARFTEKTQLENPSPGSQCD